MIKKKIEKKNRKTNLEGIRHIFSVCPWSIVSDTFFFLSLSLSLFLSSFPMCWLEDNDCRKSGGVVNSYKIGHFFFVFCFAFFFFLPSSFLTFPFFTPLGPRKREIAKEKKKHKMYCHTHTHSLSLSLLIFCTIIAKIRFSVERNIGPGS